MKHIKAINIIFENTEMIEIEAKYLMEFNMEPIVKCAHRLALNSISEYEYCHHIAISFLKGADVTHCPFGDKEYETTVFKRLQGHDITGIEFIYSDNTTRHILVDWNEDDEWSNKYQKTEVTKLGDLLLVIDKDKDIKDYFNLESYNDKEEMDFYHDGWFEND